MKSLNKTYLDKISGGNNEVYPFGIGGGGNGDHWGGSVNINVPVNDNLYVVPKIYIDPNVGVHHPSVNAVWIFD